MNAVIFFHSFRNQSLRNRPQLLGQQKLIVNNSCSTHTPLHLFPLHGPCIVQSSLIVSGLAIHQRRVTVRDSSRRYSFFASVVPWGITGHNTFPFHQSVNDQLSLIDLRAILGHVVSRIAISRGCQWWCLQGYCLAYQRIVNRAPWSFCLVDINTVN